MNNRKYYSRALGSKSVEWDGVSYVKKMGGGWVDQVMVYIVREMCLCEYGGKLVRQVVVYKL